MADGTTTVSAPALRGFAPPARRSSLKRFAQRRSTTAVVMCLPLIALILGLVVYPFFYSIWLSLLNREMTRFIGLFNYRYLLRSDTFHLVIFQSCFFAITAVFFKALIGFILAHVMHNISGRDQKLWRGLLLVPWVIPPALSTLGWWWMISGNYSAINWILVQVGLHPVAWLANPWLARLWVIAVNVWFGTPFFMIMYLATLKSVPEQLYEAAAIDGASWLQKIRYISLPMLRNIISITVLFSLIVTFANFDIVEILTSGAPANTTHVFATYAFQLGIQGGNIPLGASVSLFIFPILAIFSIFILRGVGRRAREGIEMSGVAATAGALAPRRPRRSSIKNERRWALWGSYTALVIFAIGFLIPPYFELVTSLKTSQEIATGKSPWVAHHPYLGNFLEMIRNPDFQAFFLNTVKITVLVVIITLVIAILSAYALSRMRFFGSTAFATGVFLTYLVPESLLFIPLFKVLSFLHLINSTWCLVLIWPTLSVPFCTWIMIGYFSSIPKELDEAAMIDGASHLQMLWKIFIPVAMPGIIAATIFAFTVCWGDFLYPLAYLFTGKQMVLTAGIVSTLIHGDVLDWGHIMAANILASLPPVLIYAFLMDYYIAGLTAGATKG